MGQHHDSVAGSACEAVAELVLKAHCEEQELPALPTPVAHAWLLSVTEAVVEVATTPTRHESVYIVSEEIAGALTPLALLVLMGLTVPPLRYETVQELMSAPIADQVKTGESPLLM